MNSQIVDFSIQKLQLVFRNYCSWYFTDCSQYSEIIVVSIQKLLLIRKCSQYSEIVEKLVLRNCSLYSEIAVDIQNLQLLFRIISQNLDIVVIKKMQQTFRNCRQYSVIIVVQYSEIVASNSIQKLVQTSIRNSPGAEQLSRTLSRN